MKKSVLVSAIFFTAFGLNAQVGNFSTSVSINSNLTKHLGHYPDHTGQTFGGSLLGGIVLGAISGGQYWGSSDPNEDWVTGKNVDDRSQFNFSFEHPTGAKKRLFVGMTYTNARFKHSKDWYSGKKTTTTEKFTGVTFDTRYSWYRNSWLDLSTGFSAGLARQTVTGFVKETRNPVLGQITPLRATVSHQNIGAFIAPGIGSMGTQMGLTLKF